LGVIIGDCGTTSFGAGIPVPMLDQPAPAVELAFAEFSGTMPVPVFVVAGHAGAAELVEGHGDATPPLFE
jgi:hypothetical protein